MSLLRRRPAIVIGLSLVASVFLCLWMTVGERDRQQSLNQVVTTSSSLQQQSYRHSAWRYAGSGRSLVRSGVPAAVPAAMGKAIPPYDAAKARAQVEALQALYPDFRINEIKNKKMWADAMGDPYLRKLRRQERLRQRCFPLDIIRRTSAGHNSDCGPLLPISEAYIDEVDIVVEAGSRHGITTSASLNRFPLKLSSMEIAIHRPLHAMHKYYRDCQLTQDSNAQVGTFAAAATGEKKVKEKNGEEEFFASSSKLSESRLDMGDDIQIGMPFQAQYLFLDTLHNADQLYKELEDFHSSVTQWIAIHDSHSRWRTSNEAPTLKRKDVPSQVADQWAGLSPPLHHFLNKYSSEWVEEMNHIHSHGFLVLRRRSFTLNVLAPHRARLNWMLEGQKIWGLTSPIALVEFLRRKSSEIVGENFCSRGFKVMAGDESNPGALCPDGFLGPDEASEKPIYPALGAGMNYYTVFAVSQDRIPMFSRLGGFHSFGIPSLNTSFIMGKSQTTEERTFEIAALTAALSAKSRMQRPLIVCQPSAQAADAVKVFRTLPDSEFLKYLHITDDVGSLRPDRGDTAAKVDTVYLSAATLREYGDTETFGAQGRIVVYGTALWKTTQYHPQGFALSVAMNAAVGVAMWQKVGWRDLNYHQQNEGPAPLLLAPPGTPQWYKGNKIDLDAPLLSSSISLPGQVAATTETEEKETRTRARDADGKVGLGAVLLGGVSTPNRAGAQPQQRRPVVSGGDGGWRARNYPPPLPPRSEHSRQQRR